MPVQPTYPGVYVQEVSSGVRTIVGVSTSVTAFVGKTKIGPINKPVTIYNYAEFEKQFGGLSKDSELSYAVRSFFLNGGSQALIVRLAKDAVEAYYDLDTDSAAASMTVTAVDAGKGGNDIDINIDRDTTTPESTFNLTVRQRKYDPPSTNKTANYTITRIETFTNLSMDSDHPRFVENLVNDVSELVSVEVTGTVGAIAGYVTGSVVAPADQIAYGALIDATHFNFRVSVDGGDPETISLPGPYIPGTYDTLVLIRTAINALATDFNATTSGNALVLGSNSMGEHSRVQILPGLTNDVSVRLGFGAENGGTTVDAAGSIRPAVTPAPSVLTGAAATVGLSVTGTLTISLDGNIAQSITYTALAVANDAAFAARVQTDVRALRTGVPAYEDFTCTYTGGAYVLTTGSRGGGSSIAITSTPLATTMGLTTSSSTPADTFLINGNESDFTDSEAYGVYIGSRANREGLYALEAADIFNILCLPGIPNNHTERSGILMDAESYCKERRAFMIVDASKNDDLPAVISESVVGTNYPKSNYAAIYYPWIKIPDPLNNSQLRTSAPCGVMAGLYARTDASRGVWKAPAGTEATLTGVSKLNYVLTDPENGSLNPLGVNCLRTFPVYGNISWGARTLRGNDQMADEYKYVPVRRLALYLEESLYRGLKWAVFEPNDEPLWAQIRLNVGAFMQNLFRQGAFQGQKRDDAYFVKCDKETTTQNDINLGIVNVWVGFAPLKPAEFVILYIQQIAGNLQT